MCELEAKRRAGKDEGALGKTMYNCDGRLAAAVSRKRRRTHLLTDDITATRFARRCVFLVANTTLTP